MFSVLLRIGALFLPLILASAAAHASMQIFPIRSEFKGGETTKTITIRNRKKSVLTVQISPRAWHQDEDGQDRYSETDDLLVFPRMANIDPGGEQKVRLRFRGKHGDVERAFRLLVEEVPVPEPGKAAMRFVVTMSVPIFVLPQYDTHDITVDDALLNEGAVHLSLKNAGTVHEQATTIRYQVLDAEGGVLADGKDNGWYVLAGRTRTFRVGIPEAPCRKAARIAVKVALHGEDRVPLSSEVDVAPEACKVPPKSKKPALDE